MIFQNVDNNSLFTKSTRQAFQFQISALSISKFLHCLGLIDMLSANQNAEIIIRILLVRLKIKVTFAAILFFQTEERTYHIGIYNNLHHMI